MFNTDLEFLVQQTFDCDNESHGKSPFSWNEEVNDEVIPASSGVVFSIKRNINTFVIKIHPSKNLACDFPLIQDQNPHMEFYFHETEDYHLAELLSQRVALQRFPYDEGQICNLGDPGFSWWMQLNPQSMNIYFKTSYWVEGDDFIKLGPLGDPRIARDRLREVATLLENQWQIERSFCNENRFQLRIQNFNPSFKLFCEAFLNGDMEALNQLEIYRFSPYLDNYLSELISVRSFWITVERLLSDSEENSGSFF